MRPQVLVTRPVFASALEPLLEIADVDVNEDRGGLSAEALRERIADKQALICQLTDPVGADAIDAAGDLRIIANVAVGHDNVDVAAAEARGIPVTNTPGVLTESSADFAFALLMAAARRVVEGDGFVREGRFRQWEIDLLCGQDVHGRTLGIVGMGRIGKAVARRAQGFAMDVLYASRTPLSPVEEQWYGARHVPLDTLLAEADAVTLHVPLTEATRGLIGRDALARMKPSAVLVNTARGPVVDEAALAEALRDGRIAAAGLDVFEREPEVHPDLRGLANVVLAPHAASASLATRTLMCEIAVRNVCAVLRGEAPPDRVRP